MNMINRDPRLTRRPAPTAPSRPGAAPAPGSVPTRPGMPAAPTSRKTEDIFLVMRQLCDLLVKENAALKRHRFAEVKTMAERKEHLARLYQGHMNCFHRDPGLIKGMDEPKKLTLVQSATRLAELMKENASLLKGNINATNSLLKAVVTAVKGKQEERSAAYSAAGAMNAYGVSKRQLAVSYNETL